MVAGTAVPIEAGPAQRAGSGPNLATRRPEGKARQKAKRFCGRTGPEPNAARCQIQWVIEPSIGSAKKIPCNAPAMHPDASASSTVLTGDPTLLAIVRLVADHKA